MECKVAYLENNESDKVSINRNIVECKAVPVQRSDRGRGVLIETLWNVKLHQGGTALILSLY